MARFLLIHGSSHGAWCWRDLVPRLTALGHEAVAIDLPSHGDDPTPPEDVQFEDYVSAIDAALTPGTILVGHSLAGLSVTVAAHRWPDRVAKLVYLCAWVPKPGLALADYRLDAVSPDLRTALIADRERMVTIPIPDKVRGIFYTGCTDEDVAYAAERLSPQPMSITSTPLMFDPVTMPRYYIRCLQDGAIRPDYQRSVTEDWPEGTVFELDTGHSPFFTMPDALAETLAGIAAA